MLPTPALAKVINPVIRALVGLRLPVNGWPSITVKRKQKYLGIFEDKRDAAIAYNLAAVSYFGEFATINQIGKDNT